MPLGTFSGMLVKKDQRFCSAQILLSSSRSHISPKHLISTALVI